jgi:hypothetical protein
MRTMKLTAEDIELNVHLALLGFSDDMGCRIEHYADGGARVKLRNGAGFWDDVAVLDSSHPADVCKRVREAATGIVTREQRRGR